VLRALEKNPGLRYQQAGEFKTRIETIASTPALGHTRPEAVHIIPELAQERPHPPGPVAELARPRFSFPALAGALWIGLFFLSYVVNYTPPGWAVSRMVRNTPLDTVSELFFFLPLMLLGYAALVGSSVMGLVALHQIRRGRGATRGFGLAFFDFLFFPLLLVNGWVIWLVWQVVPIFRYSMQIESSLPGKLRPLAVLALLGLLMNWFLIRALARRAKQFVNSPPPPEPARVAGTWTDVNKAFLARLVLVLVLHLALFETIERLSLHWRESTGELWQITLAVATLGGLVWACWPGYRLKRSWLFWMGGAIASAFLVLGIDNYYAWHVRPRLGLYQEPDWVAQHPGFQRQQRERIQKAIGETPPARQPTEPPP
jgi:hypothetical protein